MNVKAGYPSPRRKPILHKQMRPLHKARRIFKGTLALITNTTDISPAEAVARDKGLDGIARGFRVLKADIVIAPLLHRLPDRIRAHALIRFLALTLCRVMPLGLTAKGHSPSPSPKTIPEILTEVQRFTAHVGEKPFARTTRTQSEQPSLFDALDVSGPA